MFVIILALFIAKVVKAFAMENVSTYKTNFEKYYNSKHSPLEQMYPKGTKPPKNKLQAWHAEICKMIENGEVVSSYQKDKWDVQAKGRNSTNGGQVVLVGTPCLGTDSLGNTLTSYLENIACAYHAKMNYITVAKYWDPNNMGGSLPVFLRTLPDVYEHPNPVPTVELAKENLKKHCKCVGSCHERTNSLWYKTLDILKPIVRNALSDHMNNNTLHQNMTVGLTDISNVPIYTLLPVIPDSAIHYRCGDNFIGHYGFLPFRAFTSLIPKSARTIYVLAENKKRKANKAKQSICDAIFAGLYQYLHRHFPNATVVVRRGDNLFVDMYRLAQAPNMICSVSSFCLWPALINTSPDVHFPATKLILKGDTSINLGFKWILEPSILKGAQLLVLPPQHVLSQLDNEAPKARLPVSGFPSQDRKSVMTARVPEATPRTRRNKRLPP